MSRLKPVPGLVKRLALLLQLRLGTVQIPLQLDEVRLAVVELAGPFLHALVCRLHALVLELLDGLLSGLHGLLLLLDLPAQYVGLVGQELFFVPRGLKLRLGQLLLGVQHLDGV